MAVDSGVQRGRDFLDARQRTDGLLAVMGADAEPLLTLERGRLLGTVGALLAGENPDVRSPLLDQHGEGLRFHSVAEIRATVPPLWLVSGVIPQQALVLVYGASGSGKTFLMLDLAMSIACGRRWFGSRARKGRVIYVAGEGNIKPRLDAYMTHHQLNDQDVKDFRGRSVALNLRSGDAKSLLNGLETSAFDMGGVDLVVLDTLSAMMAGGDENSSQDMGQMIAVARQIMALLNCTVAYVHHPGKTDERGARGHSSLHAAVDAEILVRKSNETGVAKITKQRDGEPGREFAYQLLTVDLGPSLDPDAEFGERRTSCVVTPADLPSGKAGPSDGLLPREAIVLKALTDACSQAPATMLEADRSASGVGAEQPVTTGTAWQAAACAAGISEGGDDAKKKAFQRARDSLVSKGYVKVWTQYAWTAT